MNIYLLLVVALIPVIWLMVSLGGVKTPGYKAIPITFMITFLLATICFIANTTPTAFGSIGLPVLTLAKLTTLDPNILSYVVACQLGLFIIIVPIVLVMLAGKSIKSIKGVFGITLVSGLSFAIPEVHYSQV